MLKIDHKMLDVYKADVHYSEIANVVVRCRKCDTKLRTYYAEDRLYAVKCGYCDYIALVKAGSPSEAAMAVGYSDEEETHDKS
ncbi:MAG: hypothetical protein J6A19_05000 [Oscillospiraceae bacterium]|nr:hypothetical protein [Oscillospiraceae bacterium]